MSEQEKKKQVAKISVFITSIFVIFLSISYAFINQTLIGTNMFFLYSSSAALDLSNLDISKVTDMSNMFYRSSTYYGSPILVKDETMKNWVLEQNSNLTNVTIKTVNP